MKQVILLLLFTITLSVFGQGEANIWYFGDQAGLDFNSGAPTVLNDGTLSTIEGCATISSSNGTLLFYTDGTSIWNKDHNLMDNGGGLHGNKSSTQSAIIVPKSENDNQYYVFTVDEQNNNSYGLKYSVVDMNLDGGLGSVLPAEKNIPLLTHCSEKIAAFKSGTCGSIWVIAFSSADGISRSYNTFHSFEVTSAGINTTSIPSTFATNTTGGIGYLKISADGSKLGVIHTKLEENGVFMYDFNFLTGVVSNEQNLIMNDPTHANNSSFTVPYGIEFSIDRSRLYVTSITKGNTFNQSPQNGFLWQFDLTDTTFPSKLIDYRGNDLYRGALQMGPDGKIYRALAKHYLEGTHFLGAINNPNALGNACNYQHNAINLGAGTSRLGLPPFIQSLVLSDEDIVNNPSGFTTTLDLCVGDSYHLGLLDTSSHPPLTTYAWYFNDTLIPSETTSSLNINNTNFGTGEYKLRVDINSGSCVFYGVANTTFFDYPVLNTPITINQCDDDIDGIAIVNLTNANETISANFENETFTYFHSQADANANTNPINNSDATNYSTSSTGLNPLWVRVVSSTCETIGAVHINISYTNSNYNGTLFSCDDYVDVDNDDTDGYSTFNLSQVNNAVISQFPVGMQANLSIGFYHSIEDAQLQINEITDPSNYRNVTLTNTNPQRIFIRINDTTNIDCVGLGNNLYVDLTVEKLPIAHPIDALINCNDGSDQAMFDTSSIENNVLQGQTNVSLSFHYFDENDVQIPIPNADFIPSYTSSNRTIYVQVTNNNTNDTNGPCSDKTIVNLDVIDPVFPTIETITIFDNLPNNRVSVLLSTSGNYEFALDNMPFEPGNELYGHIFHNVIEGAHTIYVNEQDGCAAVSEKEIFVIRFPKFITPNHDGINDTFYTYGGDAFANSILRIYDRFGKRIAVLKDNKPWDGMYLNKIAAETDYWFVATFTDNIGKEYVRKGHFSLKK
ncbi:MAG: T9SS type B sorting domain-containing protein [Flavobacteriaceae bacterium]